MSDAERKRLHIAAAFVRVITNLPYVLLALFIGLFGGATDGSGDPTDAIAETILYVVFALFFVGAGLVRWWRFRYWIEDGEFRVLDGALVRREIFIPFERIRTVEINEGLWQRLFGVVRLEVKTGASGTQADLTAISRAEAERLKAFLRRKADVAVEGDVEGALQGAEGRSERPADTRTRAISIGELVATGATSGRLGYVLAIAAWIFGETADFTLEPAMEWAQNLPEDETSLTTIVVLAVAAAIVVLVLMFLGSIIAAVVKYGQFTVERQDDELIVRHGLLNRQTITLPVSRVQAIRYVQNPVRELMSSGALFVEAIGHAEEKGRSSELFPLLGRDELDTFLKDFLPEFRGEPVMERPPARSIIRFFALPMSLTTAAALAAIYFFPAWGWAALALVPLVAVSRWLAYKQNGIGVSGDIAHVENRTLFSRQRCILPRRAVRSVAWTSNIFQQRRELSDVGFTVASGAGGKLLVASNLDRTTADEKLAWKPGSTTHSTV